MEISAMQNVLMAAVLGKDLGQEDKNIKIAEAFARASAPLAALVLDKKFIDKHIENIEKIRQLTVENEKLSKTTSSTPEIQTGDWISKAAHERELAAMEANHKEQILSLRTQIADQQVVIESKNDEIGSLTTQIQELSEKYNALQSQLDECQEKKKK